MRGVRGVRTPADVNSSCNHLVLLLCPLAASASLLRALLTRPVPTEIPSLGPVVTSGRQWRRVRQGLRRSEEPEDGARRVSVGLFFCSESTNTTTRTE